MTERRIQSGKSYWQDGCDAGKAGKPACPLTKKYPGYMNGYAWGKEMKGNVDRSEAEKNPPIPASEENAMRHAFEEQMRKTFNFTNFSRTTEMGYENAALQAAWFACKCGWLCGRSYQHS